MKVCFALFVAVLLACSGTALALTPDSQTPSTETVCNGESGAAFGLCNAYCEAMDCESDNPAASATACGRVRDHFIRITGHEMPCENVCPCQTIPEFNAALAGSGASCQSNGSNGVILTTSTGTIFSTSEDDTRSAGACGVFSSNPGINRDITVEEGLACNQLLLSRCTPE